MIAGTTLALVAPLSILAAATALGLLFMRRRGAFLVFAIVSLAMNVAILAYVDRENGWQRGLLGGMRLAAALAGNLAILTRIGAPRILEGLRLPPRATALVAAIVLAAHDVGRDFACLRDARRLEGAWPARRLARAREAARLVAPLVLAAHRRATTRHEALQVVGLGFPAWFVPLVAIAALCAAGRIAFLVLPNVALTFVVAFLGGLLWGPWVAAAGAFFGMGITDLMLTGLYPGGFVNAPAMGLLGLLGGLLRRFDLDAAACAAIGILATFLFSLAADTLTWLLLYASVGSAWSAIVLAGFAFNVVPALVNGALFAASVPATRRAYQAWQQGGRSPTRERTASRSAPPSAP